MASTLAGSMREKSALKGASWWWVNGWATPSQLRVSPRKASARSARCGMTGFK
ncbi:hypothetical protein D3C80_1301870 [compost metagenome]